MVAADEAQTQSAQESTGTFGKFKQTLSTSLLTAQDKVHKMSPRPSLVPEPDPQPAPAPAEPQHAQGAEKGDPSKPPQRSGACRVCLKSFKPDEFSKTCCECQQRVCEDCASYSKTEEDKDVRTWRCSVCRRKMSSRVCIPQDSTDSMLEVPILEVLVRRHSDAKLGSTTTLGPENGLGLAPPRSPELRRHSDVSPASLKELEKNRSANPMVIPPPSYQTPTLEDLEAPRRQTSLDGEAIKIVIHDVDSGQGCASKRRVVLRRDPSDKAHRTRGFGMRVVGGKTGADGRLFAYIVWTVPGGPAEKAGLLQGDKILEWNGYSLIDRSFEEVCAVMDRTEDVVDLLVEHATDYRICDLLEDGARDVGVSQTATSKASTELKGSKTPNRDNEWRRGRSVAPSRSSSPPRRDSQFDIPPSKLNSRRASRVPVRQHSYDDDVKNSSMGNVSTIDPGLGIPSPMPRRASAYDVFAPGILAQAAQVATKNVPPDRISSRRSSFRVPPPDELTQSDSIQSPDKGVQPSGLMIQKEGHLKGSKTPNRDNEWRRGRSVAPSRSSSPPRRDSQFDIPPSKLNSRRASRVPVRQHSYDDDVKNSSMGNVSTIDPGLGIPSPMPRRASAYDVFAPGILAQAAQVATKNVPPDRISSRRSSFRVPPPDELTQSDSIQSPDKGGATLGIDDSERRTRRRGSQLPDISALQNRNANPMVIPPPSYQTPTLEDLEAPRRQTSLDGEAIKIVIHDVDSGQGCASKRRVVLRRDPSDKAHRTRGFGMRVVGGKTGADGRLFAYIVWTVPGGPAEKAGLLQGDKILEWNGYSLIDRSFEEVCAVMDRTEDVVDLLVEHATDYRICDLLEDGARDVGVSQTATSKASTEVSLGLIPDNESTDKSPSSPTRRKLPKTPV
uniref:PDZ domain-containing protein n=1 Tax=Lutzomyia longipalpis TaxID=7200 RepID=A0A1B0GKV4_LUTLO